MELLLILTYTAICIAIFKIFKLPLNKWTVPTAALGGVIIIGVLVLVMNYNHPYSNMARARGSNRLFEFAHAFFGTGQQSLLLSHD